MRALYRTDHDCLSFFIETRNSSELVIVAEYCEESIFEDFTVSILFKNAKPYEIIVYFNKLFDYDDSLKEYFLGKTEIQGLLSHDNQLIHSRLNYFDVPYNTEHIHYIAKHGVEHYFVSNNIFDYNFEPKHYIGNKYYQPPKHYLKFKKDDFWKVDDSWEMYDLPF